MESRQSSKKISKPSDAQLSKMVSDLLAQTILRYPHQDLSGAVDQFREDWIAMAKRMGWEHFEIAVKRARMRRFFPAPEEIEENIPTPNSRQIMKYQEGCVYCDGLGWENVGPAQPSPDNPRPKEDRYRRCRCAQIVSVAV